MNVRTSTLLAILAAFSTTAVFAHDGDPKQRDRQPMYAGPGWRNSALIPVPGSGPQPMVVPALNFPKSNVTLLSWLTLTDLGVPPGGNGNSCYGYTSPSGREYAIIGTSVGTSFVEITQPGNATLVASIPGSQSLWRDVRTFSHYCYAVSEGGGGIQVIELANIDSGSVTLANTVNDDAVSATHTLTINQQSGYLYRCGGTGSQNGLRIYNLNVTPSAPQRVGTWSNVYVHEASVFNMTVGGQPREIAFCCGGMNTGFNSTGVYVVDVTNKASPSQSQYMSYASSQYCHQCWPSPDMTKLYMDDELDDENLGVTNVVRVFNISSAGPTVALSVAGTYTNGNTSVDHNLYTRSDKIYQAAYRSGLRVYSTSGAGTPTQPVESAFFDTYPDDDRTFFNGLWNVYPYFASGTVVGSDIEKGLFVWWVGTPQLTFAFPGGSPATLPPGGMVLNVQVNESTPGALSPGSVTLHYDTGAGLQTVAMLANGVGGYSAPLPAGTCGASLVWYVSAQSSNGVIWSAPEGASEQANKALYATSTSTFLTHDFQTAQGWQGGVAGDTATSGVWVNVDPNSVQATGYLDPQPEDDHTPGAGTNCWVTGQAAVGAGNGTADVDGGKTTLLSPAFNLTGVNNPVVGYWRYYSNVSGSAPGQDLFKVDVSGNNGTSWVNAETVGPLSADTVGGWIYHQFRVADFVAPSSQVRVRFVAEDAGSGSIVEAAVDDFVILSVNCTGFAPICAGDGSGSACPCSNEGAAGAGCKNSTGGGAALTAGGAPSIGADTFVLSASNMPATATALFVQSAGIDHGGLGTPLGDGVRCIAGSSVRLGVKSSVSGASSFPQPGDAAISVLGSLSAGATRYYHVWYRDADAFFCTSATFNYSNGITATWGP